MERYFLAFPYQVISAWRISDGENVNISFLISSMLLFLDLPEYYNSSLWILSFCEVIFMGRQLLIVKLMGGVGENIVGAKRLLAVILLSSTLTFGFGYSVENLSDQLLLGDKNAFKQNFQSHVYMIHVM